MSKPTTRVLALLELLQSNGLISGAELAGRLEVDIRTLRRYIQALEALGIPVLTERGRDGGYRLMHGFKLPPMMFSNDEALALALGLVAARNFGLTASGPAAASAAAKLERVMPQALQLRMRALSASVSLDITRANALGDSTILATLSSATHHQQSVHLRYRSAKLQASERALDPYGLAYLSGHWYLVGYCHLRQDMRSFRLDRIEAAAALPMSFAKPGQFDAIGYMSTNIAKLPRAHTVRVLLQTDLASASTALFTSLGVLEAVTHGTLLHCQVDDLDWMAQELARLPFRFTIELPPALGVALARHARQLLESI
jgi:predicted DNA-binding transcriptional regulator YafY